MSDDETDEGYNEFIKVYESRYEWGNEGIPMSRDTGTTFFAQSKPTGGQRQLGIGKRKRLSNLYIVCPM